MSWWTWSEAEVVLNVVGVEHERIDSVAVCICVRSDIHLGIEQLGIFVIAGMLSMHPEES